MTNNEDIVLDAQSGISVEEQKEILAKINGIAEKNRQSLSEGMESGKPVINAKKTGAIFPLLVNAAAIVILVCGVVILFSFNGKKDQKIREGNKVYTLTERTLIEEIRRETAQKIASKEKEITSILSRLESVGEELDSLYSSKQVLSQEQLAAEARLLSLQREYRAELSASEEERAQILENSRSSEARLRNQLEVKATELTASQQEMNSRLEQLRSDQDKANAIDAQLSGGISAVNELIRKGEYDQAAAKAGELRLFLETGSFQSIRSFQSRKEFYTQAINSVEAMIEDVRKTGGASAVVASGASSDELAELEKKNAQLESTIASMQKTIASFSSDSSGQTRRLNELETSLLALEAEKKSLESEKNNLAQIVTERDNTIKERNSTIKDLETKATSQTNVITSLSDQMDSIRKALQPSGE